MLLGFYKQFVPKIENGIKIHTMRDFRKREPKPGETLHMYTGGYNASRSRVCIHTLVSTQMVSVIINVVSKRLCIVVDGRILKPVEKVHFVINDGFDNINDFIEYWISKLPKKQRNDPELIIEWDGHLHHWTGLKY